jgi:hypothetical protein
VSHVLHIEGYEPDTDCYGLEPIYAHEMAGHSLGAQGA